MQRRLFQFLVGTATFTSKQVLDIRSQCWLTAAAYFGTVQPVGRSADVDRMIGMGLQNFTPPIHISEPDFLGLIDPELLPVDNRLGPEEFEAVIRRQLQAFSQARLANVPAVRTAGDTDFLLFNTLKMVLLQLLPAPIPPGKYQEQQKQPEKQQSLAGPLPNDPIVSDFKPLHSMHGFEASAVLEESKDRKKDDPSHCCCCCCWNGNGIGGKDGQEAKVTTSSRRAQRRLLELEEAAMSELVQVIAGPVRDRLLRDVLDPLGREVARLRAGRGLITGDISCESDPSASSAVSAGHAFNNDLVLLNGREQPTDHPKTIEKQGQHGGRAGVATGGGGGAWLFPKTVKNETSRAEQLPQRSAKRREMTRQPRDPRTRLLCDIVDEAAEANAAAAGTTALRMERSVTGSGAAHTLQPPHSSDMRRRTERSARRHQHQPSPSPGPGAKDDYESHYPVMTPPLPPGGESGSPSGWGVRPSPAHTPGRTQIRSVPVDGEREGGGESGSGMSGDLAQGGNIEEQHGVGSGLMMHMRFSISQ
jgi:hypothetical protein